MNKVLSLLLTMFVSLLVPQTISAQVKFDFNASNHAVSANGVSDGDIIEAETYYMDGVTLTISPATKGTPNRYWGTGNGPQLRMYSGTITIDAGSKAITKITVGSGKWNASNTFNDVASADGNWEGSAANVILAIAGNTQMNYIEVTVSDSISGSEPPIIPSDSLNVNPPDSLIVNPSDSLIVDPSDSIIVPPVDPNAKGQQNNPYLISDEDFLNMVMGLNTEDNPKSDVIYVKGYITNIDQVSPSYGNATFKIAAEKDKDADIKLKVYRAKYLDNTNFTAEDQIGVFDEVVICGQIQWYKSEPEFIQGCYIYSLVKDSTAVIIDPQPQDTVHIANSAETAYTVAEAIRLIEAGQALDETVYVKGIISQVDAFNEKYGSITYWISVDGTTESQHLECYNGLGFDGVPFKTLDDVKVGAEVIVKGNLTKYKDIYEFNKNNELVSYVGPEVVDPNLIEIAQDQGKTLDDFARTELVIGDDYNTYTCTESIQIAFKMLDIDVKDCDYVVIKFAEPVAAGWELSLWGNNDNSTVAVPEGATEYKYVFAEDAKCAIANDVLPQITMLHLWTGTTPLVAKVKGIYKHKSAEQQPIEELTIQKDALAEAIAKGGMFNALAYTDASFSALSIAITDGEAALIDAAATAESLTAATTAVYNAIAALALKDGFSSLQDVPFGQWSGWGADAELTQTINPTWDLFTATGHSYGDIGVNNYADVSAYDKLYVTYTDGTPRILMNRDVDNGQWNENEAESHLIDNTRGGWSAKYFTTENGIVTVDLKQMATDKGFAHITAIKGANYANVTVTGLYLYKAPAVVPEIVTKKTVFTGELKSMDELQSNKFMLQSEDGMVLYTPDGWDVKVADLLTATSNMSNGGFFELNPLDGDYEGMYQIPIYNLDGSRRTYWAGNQCLNSQPNGGNIIFGLSGEAPDYGQDGPNLALWTITYDENKGFAFHCVGRDIYLGCDESAARPVESIVYWKAYTGFDAGYDEAEVLAAYEAVISAAKIQETIMTLTDAKAAYDDYGDINEFGKVVNAAIEDVKYCEALNETYSHLDETGAKVAAEIRRLYNKGAYWSVEELEKAYRRAIMAQTTAGSDFTTAIINPSFETGNLNGWISDNGGVTANNGNFGAATGSFFVERWVNSANVLSDGSLTQVISGLPAGKYVLTAEMQNLEQGNGSADGEGYYLFANNNRTAVTYAGETVVVETVLAAGDDLIIGTLIDNCTGNWVCVDNFHLTLVDPTAIIPVEDDPELEVPEGWMSMIYNGNLASDDTYSFYAKEAPNTEYYSAAIVPGAGVNGSRGIVVKSAENPEQAWDSQFWIRLNEALPAGARLHVEFDYMANQYAHTTTQMHGEPGYYHHYIGIGDVYFVPEWQHYVADVEVTSDMASSEGLLSIAFNLSEEQTATEYHFDNFAVWAKMPEPVEEWVDIMVNGDMEGESTECFYVTEQGLGGPYLAEITDGIGKNRSRAIMVQSQDSPNNSWDTQFFIRLPYQIPAGTPYRVTFDVKANKAAYFTTETHSEPGGYIYWGAIGSYGVDVWWETFEVEGVVTSDMSNEKNMMQTIAFDLAESSDATQYIFDNIKFEVPANVLDSLILNPAEDPRPYPAGRMGDVNTDREINITDVVLIIEDILQREPQNYNAELADVNKDGYVDVSDVVLVIDAILGKVELSRGAELIDRSAYTAFQMDLTIPAGYVLESVILTDIAKDSHSLAYNMLPDGRCRVVVCSMNNEALPGTWDEVISLNLRGKGDAQVNIDRAVFVTIDGERHELMMNPTSIAQISNLKSQTSTRYDLQGRKIEKTSKGIMIENGKKTIRK